MSEGHAVREVVTTFLRLGTIAFGGPVAHVAMMREELVRSRGAWQLARAALVDVWAVLILGVTLVLLWRTRLNSAWYVGGGALVGIGLGLSGLI